MKVNGGADLFQEMLDLKRDEAGTQILSHSSRPLAIMSCLSSSQYWILQRKVIHTHYSPNNAKVM